jgi:Arc/MetJ family transcription regulator
MRTNIHLDDDLVARAMALTGKTTKRAVVEEALRTLLRLHGQREVRDLRGKLRWEAEEAPGRAADVADPR